MPLKVGDRVRYRHSGECQLVNDPKIVDGLTGVVITTAWDFNLPDHCTLDEDEDAMSLPITALSYGHPYAVEWDTLPRWNWVARAELDRLSAEVGDEDG